MPLYEYTCSCGYDHQQFLRTDKDSIVLKCERCTRGVTARQKRDKNTFIKENNEVMGVFKHDESNS